MYVLWLDWCIKESSFHIKWNKRRNKRFTWKSIKENGINLCWYFYVRKIFFSLTYIAPCSFRFCLSLLFLPSSSQSFFWCFLCRVEKYTNRQFHNVLCHNSCEYFTSILLLDVKGEGTSDVYSLLADCVNVKNWDIYDAWQISFISFVSMIWWVGVLRVILEVIEKYFYDWPRGFL